MMNLERKKNLLIVLNYNLWKPKWMMKRKIITKMIKIKNARIVRYYRFFSNNVPRGTFQLDYWES